MNNLNFDFTPTAIFGFGILLGGIIDIILNINFAGGIAGLLVLLFDYAQKSKIALAKDLEKNIELDQKQFHKRFQE